MILLGLLLELIDLAPMAAEPANTSRPEFEAALAATSWTSPLSWPDARFRLWAPAMAATNRAGGNDHWRAPPAAKPDWPGLGRDTGYFLGYQFVVIGLLYVAPESVSGWSEEDKVNYSFNQWKENASNPTWDDDVWWINYLTHPYWGAAYYIRGRERGLERMPAFWYSTLLSTLFEFGAEALFEQPSYQDLVVTPVVGALIGEYLFTPLRTRIKARPGRLTGSDKALLFATDPLGVLNATTDRLFGLNLEWRLRPLNMMAANRPSDLPDATITIPLAGIQSGGKSIWGLQLQITW